MYRLKLLDSQVEWEDNAITVTRDSNTRLKGVDVDCGDIPDAAMTLAVVALFAKGKKCSIVDLDP